MWDKQIEDFLIFLRIEKAAAGNTVDAYERDMARLSTFILKHYPELSPLEVEYQHLSAFVQWLHLQKLKARSRARIVSGVKAFYRFLLYDDRITDNPATLLETPRLSRRLPDVLTVAEIEQLIAAIDLSRDDGHRNKAIIETLYSCGLRVSELTDLRLTNLYLDQAYILVEGKGNKQRLVPIGKKAIETLRIYLQHYRKKQQVAPDSENIVFLNRRGKKLSRVMIFTVIKCLAETCNFKKTVSPHTLRHSFATHLIEGGADMRAVQQMLGHESILTTEIYAHLDSNYLRSEIIAHHPRS